MSDRSTAAGKGRGEDATLLIDLRPWNEDDLPLMQAIMGDPHMTEHLGGPESPEKLRSRLDRYIAR